MKNIIKRIGSVLLLFIIIITLSFFQKDLNLPYWAFGLICLMSYIVVCSLFKIPLLPQGIKEEENTLYRKKRKIQDNSSAMKYINGLLLGSWILGICLIISGMWEVGLIVLASAVWFTRKKIDRLKIESHQKIITPSTWPDDCLYAHYNEGLNSKALIYPHNNNINFYERCKEEGITNLDTNPNRQKAILIAKTMKQKDISIESVCSIFEQGKHDYKIRKTESDSFERNQQLSKIRIDELDVLAGAMKYYGLHGREKRTAMLKDMYELCCI